MSPIDFDNLDAYNRRAEQQLREALGSGTVRDEWPRKETFWRWLVVTIAAGFAMAALGWWLA